MDAEDDPRWWCPGGADGFQAVLTDWACHPGASPPMRMAASWSGSRIRRIQACGAGSAPRASSPRGVATGRCSPQGSSESPWAFGAQNSVCQVVVRLKGAPHHSARKRRPGAPLTRPPTRPNNRTKTRSYECDYELDTKGPIQAAPVSRRQVTSAVASMAARKSRDRSWKPRDR